MKRTVDNSLITARSEYYSFLNLPLDECIVNTPPVTREVKSKKWHEEREELKQVTKSSERQEQSLTQAKIDSLGQGHRLDAIDQKPKHDSSKTEVKLDAVMQEAEGKRGNQEPQTKQKLP